MLLVYIYIGLLSISRTEPYWNVNSNEIDQFNPWISINSEFAPPLIASNSSMTDKFPNLQEIQR